ncbi:hypothetical protein IEO21_05449 [Rhodonia placenta]|uniref:Pali-domain-containing protein n=1 Tax=Rhodonia placenta TaxID=104341 RepID=A0A8H7P265_9APHY|nr:hypothetical protein IEO21_05449 [Postia placenta]
MGKALHLPGIFFLFSAFVLLLLVSISLPYLTVFDFARVHFNEGGPISIGSDSNAVSQLRVRIRADCWYEASSGRRACSAAGYAYNTTMYAGSTRADSITIRASWTRGLAIHPVAAGMSLIALLFSLSAHMTARLLAALAAFLASIITLIAFATDIALFAYVKEKASKLDGTTTTTDTAPAFWMTFAAMLLLWLASSMVCIGRRRDRMSDATNYPMASSKVSKSWRDRFTKA